ncbi:MAG: hypothetical protein AB7F22_23270 [Reyranella sp.]|uniref:hypothetical protein n=1 Tax=Reyranella sp. TaxID=1929291 RepID=UPI003D10C682
MTSKALVLALAILATDLVVVVIALLGELGNPALLVAMVNLVALFAIFCTHASGVPILDSGRRRRR